MKKATALSLALLLLWTGMAAAISIPEEKKLGKEFMETIQSQGLILKDPVALHMINTVGNHIVASLPPQPFEFTFKMINEGSFNAFASPAANIFIHRGLIAALDTMDELAGIMAHEVAHAVSRHVSQSIDRSKIVAIGSLAGMLAGVLLGSATGGDAGSAVTIGSMAAGQSSMLSFTRENETEADQKAVLFLDKTGYQVNGLLSGLNKIRETDYFGMEVIPEYFKTHPGTANRISHMAGILADHKDPADKPAPPENYDFQMVKYRVIGLYGTPELYLRPLETRLKKDPDNPALLYGVGLLYGRTSHVDLAIAYLNKALEQKIFSPMILLELGRLHIQNGTYEKALAVLGGIKEDRVLGDAAIYYTGVAQIEAGDLIGAEENLTTVLEKAEDDFPRAHFHMAHILSRRGNDPMSHYHLGVYHARTRDSQNALRHLNRAMETLKDPEARKAAKKELDKILGKKAPQQG